MALQGTLDTFALPDVLRLLASTKKTGRLVISGTRGNGSVWVDAGSVVGTEASGGGPHPDEVSVLFELLRFGGDGSFTFEAGTTATDPSTPRPVEPLLIDAERRLVEWREIEAVVPSMDAWVSLVSELKTSDITITAALWSRIVAIGSGTSVGGVARALELGELDVCRGVKELVELGLVEVGPAPAVAVAPAVAPAIASTPAPRATENLGTGATWDPFSIDIPGVAPADGDGSNDDAPIDVTKAASDDVSAPPVLSVVADMHDDNGTVMADDVDDVDDLDDDDDDDDDRAEADEVAKQLASLSPKAAAAVAAAAKATTDEDRDAALAEASDDDDEPLNRGLLLKFLSSVKS